MSARTRTQSVHTDLDGNTRRCRLCGRPGPYRSKVATHCTDCDREAKKRRDDWMRLYHLARSRAQADLINRHRDEFNELLEARRGELDGWPQDDPEIPILLHPATPAETLTTIATVRAERRAARAAAWAHKAAGASRADDVPAEPSAATAG